MLRFRRPWRRVRPRRRKKLGLSQEWVLRRLVQVVERCLQAEAVVDRKGEPVIIETLEGELAAVFTFQAMGAIRALELLGKHLQLFNETVMHQHEPEPVLLNRLSGGAEKAWSADFDEWKGQLLLVGPH